MTMRDESKAAFIKYIDRMKEGDVIQITKEGNNLAVLPVHGLLFDAILNHHDSRAVVMVAGYEESAHFMRHLELTSFHPDTPEEPDLLLFFYRWQDLMWQIAKVDAKYESKLHDSAQAVGARLDRGTVTVRFNNGQEHTMSLPGQNLFGLSIDPHGVKFADREQAVADLEARFLNKGKP